MLIIGDLLVSNLAPSPEIWKKYFIKHGTLKFVLLEVRYKAACVE